MGAHKRLIAAHSSGNSRVLVDLSFLVVARAGIELACSARRFVLLTSDSRGGLLAGTELGGKSGDTSVLSVTLGVTIFADSDAVDTGRVSLLSDLGAHTVGHIILCNGSWSDESVAGSKSFGTSGQVGGSGHGHFLELLFLTVAAVGENECKTTVLVLLTKANIDGLLSLAECLGAVENALVKSLLRKGSLGALGGVLSVRHG